MAALLSCPVCDTWADIKDTRRVDVGILRRKYTCANGHRFITMSTEVVVSILDDEGKYVSVNKTEPLECVESVNQYTSA